MAKSIGKQNTRRLEQFPYEIVIPISANDTAVQLRDTTLMLCKAYRIPANKISVFLAEKNQQTEFQSILIPGTFGRIIAGIPVNEIFPVGSQLIFMAPNLTGFYELTENSRDSIKPLKSLLSVIKLGFYECEKTGSFLWGIQHIKKKKCLKLSISHNLKIIPNTFYGCVYTGIDSKLKFTEDIERSILYYRQNLVVVRLNMFGVTSTKETQITEREMRNLQKKYPEYVLLIDTNKGLKLKLRVENSKNLSPDNKKIT
jgi:hypothetical protein